MTPGPEPEPASAARVPGRMRRAIAAAAATLGLSAVFVAATSAGVAFHLNIAAARRAARDATNVLFGSLFEGKIVAEGIDSLTLHGIRISAAEALDPHGVQVIRASGLEARVDLLPLLTNVLFGKGTLTVRVPYIRVEHAEVLVETDGAGGVTVGNAFVPRPTSTSAPPSVGAQTKTSRPLVIDLSHIEIGRGWVHGNLAPPRALDADVKRLRGSVRIDPEGVAVDVDQTGLLDRAFLPAQTRGTANYHLRAGKDLQMWSSFVGQLGEVGITARGILKNGHLEAEASTPLATPAQLASLIPDYPILEPISAQVQIDGDVPTFDVTAAMTAVPAGAAGGSVALEGRLDATGPVRFDTEAHVRDVDLRLFGVHLAEPTPAPSPAPVLTHPSAATPAALVSIPAAESPSAPKINADGHLRVEIGDALRLTAEARTAPTEALGQAVPAADVHLVYDHGELHGTTHLDEAGMPIDATFSVLPRGAGVIFAATTNVASLQAAPRLSGLVEGSGRVRVEGKLHAQELDARVTGAFSGLKLGTQVELQGAQIEGRIFGPLDALAVNATLSGHDARAGGYAFTELDGVAAGPLAAPRLRATLTDGDNTLNASARLTSASGALRDIDLKVRREGSELTGKVASITPTHGGLAVEGVDVSSEQVGALRGRLAVRGDDVTGTLRGEGVDLGRVARMLDLPLQVRGLANLDIELAQDRKNGRSGRVLLELEDGEVSFMSGLSAHLSATIDHDQLKADGLVRIIARSPETKTGESGGLRCNGTIASVRFSGGAGSLKGPLLRAATWTDLVGTAEIATPEDWDVGCLAQLAPIGHLVSEVSGSLSAQLRVSRAQGDPFPSVEALSLRTRDLKVAGPHKFGEDHPAWESRFIDGQLKGSLDGTTGRAEAALSLFDGELLGDVSGSIDLDLAALAGPSRKRWATLLSSPITGTASIPRRALSSFTTLPSFVRDALPPLGGELRIDAYANGTVARPSLAVRALGWGINYVDSDEPTNADFAFPVDIDTLLTYDSTSAKLSAHITRGPHEIATVNAEADAALDDLLASRPRHPQRPAWKGNVELKLNDVPLGEIPLLGDNGIGGKATGTITVRDLNAEPKLSADVDLLDLVLASDVFFERGKLVCAITPTAEPGRGELRLTELSLDSYSGGKLKANAYASVRWRDQLVPKLDGESANLFASAQRFPLAAFQPLVGQMLSKLEGYLDGDVQVELGRPGEAAAESLRAKLQIAQGVVHIPELGQELHDVTARITAENGIVRVENISAAGTTGRAQGWMLLRLAGLALRDGAGRLSIAKGEELPLTLEGVPLGNAWSEITFIAEKKEAELAVRMSVPTLHLALPATSGRNVQSLEDNPEIAVSLPLGPEKRRRSADALRYELTFDLGDVSVEGSGLKLHLTGAEAAPPRVVLSDEVRTSGDIVLTRGEFEVVGKVFELERGLVRLRELEPSNPYVNLTAHWDAPDGTRIFVDFVGDLRPITDKKLRFRSNPPSSQQDILARLLFGPDFADGTTESTSLKDATGAAASVGGELASAQFNTLLSGITPLRGLSTRFGTTSEGGLKTSVVYQLDDKLRALASFQEGSTRNDTATGTSPITAGGTAGQRAGRTEITVDWRFHKNWTLRGTVGVEDSTTSSGVLDLLWQYRY